MTVPIGAPKPRLLDSVGPDILARLEERRYEPGQAIISAGRPCDGLYLHLSGRVRVSTGLERGGTVLFAIERGPGILGGVEIMRRLPAISDVTAVDRVGCARLSVEDFHGPGLADAGLLSILAADLADKLALTSRASMAKSEPAGVRLARYLLDPPEDSIRPRGSSELASYLGLSTRHLNRELVAFRELGAIGRGDDGMGVTDRGTLERVVEGGR